MYEVEDDVLKKVHSVEISEFLNAIMMRQIIHQYYNIILMNILY